MSRGLGTRALKIRGGVRKEGVGRGGEGSGTELSLLSRMSALHTRQGLYM